MAKFITTSAYLLVTVIVDLFVRLLGRGELALTSRILDISVLVALIAYVAQHSADYIETLITNFSRLFAIACVQCIFLRCTVRNFRSSWRNPDAARDQFCICGSGKPAKNC
ncbi:MAG TPA: hypothetical protein VNB54_11305, partial [Alphaproteobacteria bacterium]|nr:hypothetical protein [Alphaproteobacteria bacterium]